MLSYVWLSAGVLYSRDLFVSVLFVYVVYMIVTGFQHDVVFRDFTGRVTDMQKAILQMQKDLGELRKAHNC